nr:ribonuclease H-like domain-containing protein [Tanacetum cinerariifolium]
MDSDDAHIVVASKVPMLKPRELKLWRMRIEQYIQMMDYALWDIIENGNSILKTQTINNAETVIPPTTADEKLQRRNEVKARSTLMMGLPNEHQVKFNSFKYAKSLLAAIEKRFGGYDATKKTQRNLLKQQYENFSGSSSESLGQTFDKLQKLQMALLTMRARRFLKNTGRKLNLTGNDSLAFDKTKVECYNCHKRGHFARECQAPKGKDNRSRDAIRKIVLVETPNSSALVSCDGLGGYDWSNQAEERPTNYALMAYSTPSASSSDSEASAYDEEEEVEKQEVKPSINRINFIKATTENNPKEKVKTCEQPKQNTHRKKGNHRNWNGTMSHRPNKKLTALKNSYANKNVKTVWVKKVNTAKPKAAVNAVKAKAKYNVVKGNRGNAVKTSACWGNPQKHLQDKGVIDSGCSRHMTVNVLFLTNYEEIDEGYVAFGGNPKGGKITGKCKIKTGKIDFENVYFDETSGTLKSFITRVENLINLRVKVIRCDNRTEFKNREMNQFCELKGIMRQYSVARTPQQNRVAERRNRTLIEAARTMLTDSKLPTIFWAETVHTACYVQNRVLVTKPHRTPAISFLRPFECPVTILNTIDYLGKFDGKADEGFFVGYSLNSKAFRVFNSRTRIVEENLHTVVARSNDFSGTKASNDTRKEKEPDRDYILLPLWTADSPFSTTLKSSQDNEFQPSNDNINTASSSKVNVIGTNISIDLPPDPNMPSLEDIGIFEDSHDNEDIFGAEADFYNLDSTFQVRPIPITRIHKDHLFEQVIGDLHLNRQQRPPKLLICLFHISIGTQEGTSSFKRSKLDRSHAEGASTVQISKYVKKASTPMETSKPLLKDEDGAEVNVHLYRSMIGSLMYLTSSRPDIMFVCKKQIVVANSTTEAEYVAASSCCGQVLWIQNQLLDYGVNAAIDIVKVFAVKYN